MRTRGHGDFRQAGLFPVSGLTPAAAIVSPLPPAPTGVAEYSARIGAALAERAPVALLTPAQASRARGYERVIYQIGNNGLHAPVYRAALERRGVVELHDAVLHHMLLGALTRREYEDEFAYNEGESKRPLGAALWRERALSGADERFFRYPLLRRLVESAAGVIVHNPAARRRVEAVAGRPWVREIPHYVEAPARSLFESDEELRRRWSIPAGSFVVSCFGHQRPTKRLRSVLEARRRIGADCLLLIVGDFVEREYERALSALLESPRVARIPYVAENDFWRLAFLTDVCVNLRYPRAGETSANAVKLMAAGKPVIVTRGEEHAALPPGAVIPIDSGETEVEMLTECLLWLMREPEARAAVGRQAAAHMQTAHSIERVAQEYLRVMESLGAPQ